MGGVEISLAFIWLLIFFESCLPCWVLQHSVRSWQIKGQQNSKWKGKWSKKFINAPNNCKKRITVSPKKKKLRTLSWCCFPWRMAQINECKFLGGKNWTHRGSHVGVDGGVGGEAILVVHISPDVDRVVDSESNFLLKKWKWTTRIPWQKLVLTPTNSWNWQIVAKVILTVSGQGWEHRNLLQRASFFKKQKRQHQPNYRSRNDHENVTKDKARSIVPRVSNQ